VNDHHSADTRTDHAARAALAASTASAAASGAHLPEPPFADAPGLQAGLTVENARLRQQLRDTTAAAEAASRARDDFMAMLAHEMKSPLGAITIWASLLRMGRLPAEKREHALEVIERNAAILSRFIEELMDVSRVVTGKLALDVHPVDLAVVADSALDTVRAAAEAKGIRLEQQVDPLAQVPGDPARLQQVLSNLLANAVKFSERDGHVLLRIAAEPSGAVITVRDTGEGIASDVLPHVFERFRQGSAAGARVHGGLGLGLAIVREIVELHHGTVTAQSDGHGQGTTFTVRLPFVQGAEALRIDGAGATDAPEPPVRVGSMLGGVHVLVVESDPDVRSALVVALDLNGAQVATAASPADALEQLVQEPPDVLVTAVTPGEDGVALIRRVRSLAPMRGGRVPAAALTGCTDRHELDRLLGAGYQMHLAKPVNAGAVVAAVARLAAH
jgi:signal transduction histidine kinase/CheY-like chemotaxis protein